MDAARSGPRLQFGQDRAAILRSRRGQGRGIDDHEAGRDVGQPAAELDHERVKATRELLRDRAALRRLHGAEVLIEQEHFGVVSSKEQSAREGRRADDEHQVTRLESPHEADQRPIVLQPPVRRLTLRQPQCAVPLPPAGERRQA